MADTEQHDNPKGPSIFLCLSGGGFRATLFHYGCLKRLHQLGILGRVHSISATSGGSIAAACFLRSVNGVDKGAGVYKYEWEKFERQLLRLILNGAMGQVNKLLFAYVFYVIGFFILTFNIIDISRILACLGLDFRDISATLIWVGKAFLLLGISLHFWLIVEICKKEIYTSFRRNQKDSAKRWAKLGVVSVKAYNKRRLIKTFFQPSFLRIETMNALAFGGKTFDTVRTFPKLFLTAVNLNDGLEMVFSQKGIYALDSRDCSLLWKGYDYKDVGIELATAVAASTAFPPIFRPVPVYSKDELRGVFVDGGVIDNLAFKVPEALALHIHPTVGSFAPDLWGGSFKDVIEYVLILDGSQPLVEKKRKSWPRWRSMKRVIDAMSEHVNAASIAALNFERNTGISSAIVSLREGFPWDNKLYGTDLHKCMRRVRTHLDKFNLEECAVLAYSGYSFIDYLARYSPSFEKFSRCSYEAQPFEEILPKELGTWKTDVGFLGKILGRSHLRFASFRWLSRIFSL